MLIACPANLRKVLTRIASNERVSLSADDLSAIIMSCRGDVRHAILTLQLHLAPLKKAKGSKVGRPGHLAHVLGLLTH